MPDVQTYGRTSYVKIVIPSGRNCGRPKSIGIISLQVATILSGSRITDVGISPTMIGWIAI